MIRTALIALLAACVVALVLPSWHAIAVVAILLCAFVALLFDARSARADATVRADVDALKKQIGAHEDELKRLGHLAERGTIQQGAAGLNMRRI